MVQKIWNELPDHYPHVETDEFIVMPNHFHGIIVLTNVGAQFIAPSRMALTEHHGATNQGVINHAPTGENVTVGEIMRAFKARCTNSVNRIHSTPGVPLWQRNYYEHIIRDDRELNAIREYLRYNPLKWAEDEENPVKA